MSNLQEIKSGVLGLDTDGLNEVINTIKFRRKELSRLVKNQFSVGDTRGRQRDLRMDVSSCVLPARG